VRLEGCELLNNAMGELVVLLIEGFTSMRTLRSASSASTTSPASINNGLTSLYLHTADVALGFGRGGTIFAISVHSGAKCFGGSDSRKGPPCLAVEVSKTVVVDILTESGAFFQ
jgi:hypothetical protein